MTNTTKPALPEPVAYLHDVVAADGEPDQALSFSPDNFPLAGVGGFRSVLSTLLAERLDRAASPQEKQP